MNKNGNGKSYDNMTWLLQTIDEMEEAIQAMQRMQQDAPETVRADWGEAASFFAKARKQHNETTQMFDELLKEQQ